MVIGYCDSDFTKDLDQLRSTSGFLFTLNNAAIIWGSKLQSVIATSTCEAELIAASAATREALWLRKLCRDYGLSVSDPATILCDNQSTIAMMKNPVISNRTKHIDIQHLFACERVQRGEVKFVYINTSDNAADAFTKPLVPVSFKKCRDKMGLF
jgi:hypothetical protein